MQTITVLPQQRSEFTDDVVAVAKQIGAWLRVLTVLPLGSTRYSSIQINGSDEIGKPDILIEFVDDEARLQVPNENYDETAWKIFDKLRNRYGWPKVLAAAPTSPTPKTRKQRERNPKVATRCIELHNLHKKYPELSQSQLAVKASTTYNLTNKAGEALSRDDVKNCVDNYWKQNGWVWKRKTG